MLLFSGTVLAQALPFAAAPWIARLYTPEQFAVFGTLLAVFGPLGVIAAGRYELAVMLPQDDERSSDLVRGTLLVALVMGVCAFGAVTLFGSSTRISAKLPGLDRLAWAAALLTCMAGVQLVLQQWLLRRGRFDMTARLKVAQAVGITVLTVALGMAHFGDGLLIGYVGGWMVFVLASAWYVARHAPLAGQFAAARSKAAMKEHRDWPLMNSWPAIINAIASGMATFYMVSYFDQEIAGQHNFARQYVLVPVSMVTVALGQVIFVRCAERVRERKALMPELRPVLIMLACCAVLMLLILWMAGGAIFAFLFGRDWMQAGEAAAILGAGYGAQLIASPFGMVLVALRKVHLTVVFPALFMGLLLLLPWFKEVGAMGFMGLLSAVELIAYATLLVLVLVSVREHDKALAR
jgi:O-antigen/teichoic acid export membrane protein